MKIDFSYGREFSQKQKLEIRKNLQNNFMGDNFPGGNFLGAIFQGHFSGSIFPRGIFTRTAFVVLNDNIAPLTKYIQSLFLGMFWHAIV